MPAYSFVRIEHGSLYPALHRLGRRVWIAANCEPAGKDLERVFDSHRLIAIEKKQLLPVKSNSSLLTGPIVRIIWPAEEKLK